MKLATVDPGRRGAIAWWLDGPHPGAVLEHEGWSLVSWRVVHMPREDLHVVVADAELSAAPAHPDEHWVGFGGGDTLVVEGQWVGDRRGASGARGNHGDVIPLVERRCAWQDAAILRGAHVEVVRPSSWMRMALQCPGSSAGERVRWLVGEVLGIRVSLDEAAAIGIGLWWLRHR
jgi:hypothetical protein